MNDLLEIRNALDEVLSDGAKDAARKFAETFVGEGAVVAGAALGGLCGAFAGQAVKLLLNTVLKKNDEILSHVKSLIAEPLLTGLSEAELGMMVAGTPQDEAVRQHSLTTALDKLESACSHASLRGDESAKCRIRIVQGFCALALGATGYAQTYFSKAIPYLNAQVQQAKNDQEELRKKCDDYHASIAQVRAGRRPRKETANLFSTAEEQCRYFAQRAENATQAIDSLERQEHRLAELIGVLEMLPRCAA